MRNALLATVIISISCALALAGCGGEDPTAPRDVRPVEVEQGAGDAADAGDAEEAPEQDADAPSHGLPCEPQLAMGSPFGLCGAATDNYKASFNEDPAAPERRTWLAVHQLELDGVRWQPAEGTELAADEVTLVRADGEAGELTLTADVVEGPGDSVRVRTGPQRGLWGPLLTIESVDALREAGAVTVRVTVRDADGAEHAVGVQYRLDGALAQAPEGSLEHNGPGGRWEVAGAATGTNVELGWE